MGDLAPVLIPVGILAVLGWIVRTIVQNLRQQRIAKLQADLQTRLLDKFGSPQELVGYLESPAGQRFLDSATIERRNPYGRILGSVQAGLILSLVGLALFFLQGRWPETEEGFLFLATLSLALGIGFLLSSIAAYALSKSWGLLDKGHPTEGS
jgi:hypothetical protein